MTHLKCNQIPTYLQAAIAKKSCVKFHTTSWATSQSWLRDRMSPILSLYRNLKYKQEVNMTTEHCSAIKHNCSDTAN